MGQRWYPESLMVPERFGVAFGGSSRPPPQPQLLRHTELISPRIPSASRETTTIENHGKNRISHRIFHENLSLGCGMESYSRRLNTIISMVVYEPGHSAHLATDNKEARDAVMTVCASRSQAILRMKAGSSVKGSAGAQTGGCTLGPAESSYGR